ncbi:uncharacterized protein LOC131663087 [Phymastichus coffea]|uniref:uncharacterized protein LOC131663087 n=1 Tax=Phymastichus coffea TaxID=108790 RepID=UPI00273ACFBA|nr:uncharacterized protein LOC131663087 [Phymastichus coffea]XP_058789165.1 uncharacterized protein LOC131663087 [Phymastichus coffea]
MERRQARSCLLSLLVIACCTSILAAQAGDRRSSYRSSGDEVQRQSSQQQRQLQRIRSPRRLGSRHNELATTESSRRTTQQHALIAGHLRTESVNLNAKQQDLALEDGLLLSSAGGGKDSRKSSASGSEDDDKKTLAQQVKEGKYGLLQNELFAKGPKRPGILSYSSNSEVPRDNLKNLGGLDEDEIWLAENHLLVLKGGNFHDADATTELQASDVSWPPIDDYSAPRRQVKIPPRPKVPPPFPVQLTEDGPVQLLGSNGTSFVAENDTIDFEALPGGFKGFLPGEGPYFSLPTSNASSGSLAALEKRHKAEGSPGPFYPALPPGAVIVPPPSNQTDYDEDQSIYYPPPYSFVYSQDNSTDIPPGPLVPGIILPPPPDFFSSLNDAKASSASAKDKQSAPGKQQRPSSTTTPLPTARPSSLPPPRKFSTKLYKTPSVTARPVGFKSASYSPKPLNRAKAKNGSSSSSSGGGGGGGGGGGLFQRYQHASKTSAAPPTYKALPFVELTTPLPAKSTTLESPERFHIEPILGNQVTETSTQKPWKAAVSSKAVPLLTFYASTTPTSLDQPVETTPSAVNNVGLTTEDPGASYPSQASYYFYEEASNDEQAPCSTPAPVLFFSTTAETPPYYNVQIAEQPEQPDQPERPDRERKDYYDVEMIPSRQTSKDLNVKLIDSIAEQPQIYKYIGSGATNSREKFESPPIRSQSPRMLHSEPLYYQPVPTRSSPRLSYFSTPKPKSYYDRAKIGESLFSGKSKPIYQYSFEATNYKRNEQPKIREPARIYQQQPEPAQIPTPRRQKELSLFNEYHDIQSVSGADQYGDYEGGEAVADQRLRADKLPYLGNKKKERAYYPQSTTAVPVRATTLAGHQQYFTKQDEQLLDDVTREYFTMFGKKLSGKLPSTTPIYGKSSVSTERPAVYNANSYAAQQPPAGAFRAANIKVHYGDATPGPFSLKDDALVNYKKPLPSSSPDAEFVSAVRTPRPSSLHGRYRAPAPPARPRPALPHLTDYTAPFVGAQPAISLADDVVVNYKPQRPPVNPDAEFISPVAAAANVDKPNSYFAYRLPGDGGHFYFLTPQAIDRQQPSSYLYSRPSRASWPLPRSRRVRDAD